MLHRTEELRNLTVRAVDGDAGRVEDIYFDDESWIVRYVVVDTGSWLFGRRVLIHPIALGRVRWEKGEEEGELVLPVNLTREQVENGPDINLDEPVSRQQMIELNEYYGWPAYWAGSKLLGTATVSIYPMVLAGVEALEEEIESEGGVSEKHRGDPDLRSAREVSGYHVRAVDGDVGSVEDFFVSDDEWAIRYLLVDSGTWLSGRRVLLSPNWVEDISWGEREVELLLTRRRIEESPEYDPTVSLRREYEAALHRHYGRPGYWE